MLMLAVVSGWVGSGRVECLHQLWVGLDWVIENGPTTMSAGA